MSIELLGQQPVPFKNRRGWLIAFGVFEILIACLCLLTVVLVILALTLPQFSHANPSQQNQASQAGGLIAAILVYGGAAAAFLTIGVGSIRCRNWARIAMLVVSGFWLGTGILSTLVIALVIPNVMRQQGSMSTQARHGVLLVMIVFMAFIMILLPAVFLIFYSRKSVKATCLSRTGGQVPGTTSIKPAIVQAKAKATVPVPVIILAVWQGFGVFAPLGLLMVRTTFLFGFFLHGTSAVLYLLAYSVLSGYAAWSIYQRKLVGWEIGLFITLFGMASYVTTFAGRALLQIYREMGFTENQLQVFYQFPQILSITFIMSLVSFTGYFAFLVYTRKFFSAQPGSDSDALRP